MNKEQIQAVQNKTGFAPGLLVCVSVLCVCASVHFFVYTARRRMLASQFALLFVPHSFFFFLFSFYFLVRILRLISFHLPGLQSYIFLSLFFRIHTRFANISCFRLHKVCKQLTRARSLRSDEYETYQSEMNQKKKSHVLDRKRVIIIKSRSQDLKHLIDRFYIDR